MRERKIYPNISDEELDRRAEEALKRMLANPQKQPGQHQQHQNSGGGGGGGGRRRHRRRPK
jgi:hypothetical protein